MVSEAIVAGTPVIASRIAGNVGLLGEDYPGYFEVGDTDALASLIFQVETDYTFLASLKSQCQKPAADFAPAREKKSWIELLEDLVQP